MYLFLRSIHRWTLRILFTVVFGSRTHSGHGLSPKTSITNVFYNTASASSSSAGLQQTAAHLWAEGHRRPWRSPEAFVESVFFSLEAGAKFYVAISILPESLRWLAAHNRKEDSFAVLRRRRGSALVDETIVRLHDIVRAVEEELALDSGLWRTLLKADKIHSRRHLRGIHAIICRCRKS